MLKAAKKLNSKIQMAENNQQLMRGTKLEESGSGIRKNKTQMISKTALDKLPMMKSLVSIEKPSAPADTPVATPVAGD